MRALLKDVGPASASADSVTAPRAPCHDEPNIYINRQKLPHRNGKAPKFPVVRNLLELVQRERKPVVSQFEFSVAAFL